MVKEGSSGIPKSSENPEVDIKKDEACTSVVQGSQTGRKLKTPDGETTDSHLLQSSRRHLASSSPFTLRRRQESRPLPFFFFTVFNWVSNTSEYEIEILDDNCSIYHGIKIISSEIRIGQSFIRCSEIQLKSFATLLSLVLDESSILYVSDIVDLVVDDGVSSTFFVVEEVKSGCIF
ncbi:uncharacterized protein LOC130819194 isoform X1 [Amaranthus tricolor]|uniref:uncharacterized protein LOC130819194 isoform X1 n=1 Tax=Amaranthus tricolor TaxID=29722 RepID=UPI00258637B1|nr:uncharacterized protein LOC130819194 isoform X1 [Amaranthus tricolor]